MKDRGKAETTVAAHKRKARWQLFFSGLSFGLMAVLVRFASREESGFSWGQTATIRAAVGAILSLALFRIRPGTFRPNRRSLLFTRGALGGLAVLLYFVSLASLPAAVATMINNTCPVIGTVISFFTFRDERPTVHLAFALVLVTVAVALVIGPGTESVAMGLGTVAALGSAITAGVSLVNVRALRATDNAPTIFFAFCLGGLVVSAPFSLGSWPTDPWLWCAAVGAGVVSMVAQLLMTAAYGPLTVAEAALWQQLTPLASYLWALALLDERLSPLGVAGILLGVSGVAYGTILGHRVLRRRAG